MLENAEMEIAAVIDNERCDALMWHTCAPLKSAAQAWWAMQHSHDSCRLSVVSMLL